MKIIAILLLTFLSLFGSGYDFKEQRYIYSVDKTMEMAGRITFDKAGMRIDYNEPGVRHIIYDGRSMDVVDASGKVIQHVDLDDTPMMKIYMDFIYKLYRGDYEALSDNFKIQKSQTAVLMTPIAPIDKVIKSVVVHKTPKGLSEIQTKMSNGDEITLHITQ